VSDSRFMVVCFVEPIFAESMLDEFMSTSPMTVAVERLFPVEDSNDGVRRALRRH